MMYGSTIVFNGMKSTNCYAHLINDIFFILCLNKTIAMKEPIIPPSNVVNNSLFWDTDNVVMGF